MSGWECSYPQAASIGTGSECVNALLFTPKGNARRSGHFQIQTGKTGKLRLPTQRETRGKTNYSAAAASALASASVPRLPESFPDRHNQSDFAYLPVAVPAPA